MLDSGRKVQGRDHFEGIGPHPDESHPLASCLTSIPARRPNARLTNDCLGAMPRDSTPCRPASRRKSRTGRGLLPSKAGCRRSPRTRNPGTRNGRRAGPSGSPRARRLQEWARLSLRRNEIQLNLSSASNTAAAFLAISAVIASNAGVLAMGPPRRARRSGSQRLSVALDGTRSASEDRRKMWLPQGEAGTAVPRLLPVPASLIAEVYRSSGSAAWDDERNPAHTELSESASKASADSTWAAISSRVGTNHLLHERRHDAFVERDPDGLQRAGLPDLPDPPGSEASALRTGDWAQILLPRDRVRSFGALHEHWSSQRFSARRRAGAGNCLATVTVA